MRLLFRALTVLSFSCLALPLAAQGGPNRTGSMGSGMGTGSSGNAVRAPRLPYTAEYKVTNIRTLANGTTITRESTEVRALDSQGRLMAATTTTLPAGEHAQPTFVTVVDPAAHNNTSWNSPGKQATIMQIGVPGSGISSCVGVTLPSDGSLAGQVHPHIQREKPSIEDLGTETIQGVEAHGRRTTMITPAGTIGNSEPLTTTTERWMATAPGLSDLLVRMVTDSPESGKQTRELVSLTQSEPDPSVFEPPEGYEVVTQEMHPCVRSATAP